MISETKNIAFVNFKQNYKYFLIRKFTRSFLASGFPNTI